MNRPTLIVDFGPDLTTAWWIGEDGVQDCEAIPTGFDRHTQTPRLPALARQAASTPNTRLLHTAQLADTHTIRTLIKLPKPRPQNLQAILKRSAPLPFDSVCFHAQILAPAEDPALAPSEGRSESPPAEILSLCCERALIRARARALGQDEKALTLSIRARILLLAQAITHPQERQAGVIVALLNPARSAGSRALTEIARFRHGALAGTMLLTHPAGTLAERLHAIEAGILSQAQQEQDGSERSPLILCGEGSSQKGLTQAIKTTKIETTRCVAARGAGHTPAALILQTAWQQENRRILKHPPSCSLKNA